MNANELADELEDWYKGNQINDTDPVPQAATMLRQQQAEIEALKQIIDANNLNQNIGQFVKTANKPVAWMLADKEAEHIRSIMAVQHDFVPEGCVEIPLYTHPVKELTKDEIRDVWREIPVSLTLTPKTIEFARAILRKAQEK